MAGKKLYKYGLIGRKIDYSFSRGYFADKFKIEKLAQHRYDNYDLENLDQLPKVLADPQLCGLNVTIPYKEKILSYLDSLSLQANAIGAVNTIVFNKNGQISGHNTDAYGFEKALFEQWKPNTKKALILGTGGASKAVKYVLEKHQIYPQFVSRQKNKNSLTYQELSPDILREHKLIVNCTPLGTFPEIKAYPLINYSAIGSKHFLFDLIYNPAQTSFMRKGMEMGAQTSNGLQMLIHQAEEAWRLWQD